MKKLLIILGIILAIAVVAFFVVASSLGSIVKSGVNRVGPQLTQSRVELKGARISPFSGQGTLTQLTIDNPSGWTSERAFSLGRISIDVDPRSLFGDHIIVRSVVIEQPEIVYETRITSSNLQDLLKNIQQATGSSETSPKTKDGKPVKIEIQSFRMLNAKITAIAGNNQGSVVMPDLLLENLGTREGGLTPQQLAVAVMKSVTTQAAQAGARAAIQSGALERGLEKILGGKKKP